MVNYKTYLNPLNLFTQHNIFSCEHCSLSHTCSHSYRCNSSFIDNLLLCNSYTRKPLRNIYFTCAGIQLNPNHSQGREHVGNGSCKKALKHVMEWDLPVWNDYVIFYTRLWGTLWSNIWPLIQACLIFSWQTFIWNNNVIVVKNWNFYEFSLLTLLYSSCNCLCTIAFVAMWWNGAKRHTSK